MSTPGTNDRHDDDTPCDDSASVWPMLLATESALFLGYFVGRVSFARDVREAMRRIEESPELIEISIRAL
jgi:hypothetical protein